MPLPGCPPGISGNRNADSNANYGLQEAIETMTKRGDYAFADLNDKPSLVREIVKLEQRLQEEIGEDITLIAYSQHSDEQDGTDCRPGLDG